MFLTLFTVFNIIKIKTVFNVRTLIKENYLTILITVIISSK